MLAAACLGLLAMSPPETPSREHGLPSALDVAGETNHHPGRPGEAPSHRPSAPAAPPTSPPARPPSAGRPRPGLPGVTPVGAPSASRYAVPPLTGDGLLGGGLGLLALGGFSLTAGLLVLGEPRAGAPVSPALTLSLGALSVAGGTASTVYGVRRKRRYQGWLEDHHLPPTPSGLGLIVGGGASVGLGALGVALTFAEVDTKDDEPLTAPLYFVFGSAVVAGVTMAAVGWVRHRRYHAWLSGLPIEWAPYVAPTDAGVSLGAVGRF